MSCGPGKANETRLMNIPLFLLFAAVPYVIVLMMAMALPPRIRMERRARALLAQHPDAERTSVYLAFRSGSSTARQREMDARIAEMASAGWTFLRAAEASPLRTMRSWGGGLTLHFIRTKSSETSQGTAKPPFATPGSWPLQPGVWDPELDGNL